MIFERGRTKSQGPKASFVEDRCTLVHSGVPRWTHLVAANGFPPEADLDAARWLAPVSIPRFPQMPHISGFSESQIFRFRIFRSPDFQVFRILRSQILEFAAQLIGTALSNSKLGSRPLYLARTLRSISCVLAPPHTGDDRPPGFSKARGF